MKFHEAILKEMCASTRRISKGGHTCLTCRTVCVGNWPLFGPLKSFTHLYTVPHKEFVMSTPMCRQAISLNISLEPFRKDTSIPVSLFNIPHNVRRGMNLLHFVVFTSFKCLILCSVCLLPNSYTRGNALSLKAV